MERGSVLTSTLVLMLIIGFLSLGALTTARMLSLEDIQKEKDTELLASANAGLELCRSLMHFEDPAEFVSYMGAPPSVPSSLQDTNGDCRINSCTVDWQVAQAGSPDKLKVLVTATNASNQSLTVFLDVKIPDFGEYSFASNYMHSGWSLGTPQDWYGKLYWYTDNGSTVRFNAFQTFWDSLESWEFGSSQPSYRYLFVEGNDHHITHAYNDGSFGRFDANIDLDQLFSTSTSDQGFPTTATIKFDSGMAHGLGEEARPREAEIFLSPDGYIYWRHCGDGPDDWNLIKDSEGNPVPQDGTTLYVEQEVWVRGVVTGKMTIAGGEDVYINGNIIREDSATCALGIMAQDDIYWEVRREFESGNQEQILDIFSNDGNQNDEWIDVFYDIYNGGQGSFSNIKTNGFGPKAYIAEPVFDPANPQHAAFMAQYPEYTAQWDYWNGQYAGNVPPNTVMEASLYSGDSMGPSAPFHILQYLGNGETFGWRYDSTYYHPSTSWRSGGTYFMAADWPDYVENWQTATYGEHPFASVIRPPGFAQLTSGTPVVIPGSYGIIRN